MSYLLYLYQVNTFAFNFLNKHICPVTLSGCPLYAGVMPSRALVFVDLWLNRHYPLIGCMLPYYPIRNPYLLDNLVGASLALLSLPSVLISLGLSTPAAATNDEWCQVRRRTQRAALTQPCCHRLALGYTSNSLYGSVGYIHTPFLGHDLAHPRAAKHLCIRG